MSAPITNLQAAQRDAIMNRPAVNGFPHLAETLRRAGVRTNTLATGDAKPVRD